MHVLASHTVQCQSKNERGKLGSAAKLSSVQKGRNDFAVKNSSRSSDEDISFILMLIWHYRHLVAISHWLPAPKTRTGSDAGNNGPNEWGMTCSLRYIRFIGLILRFWFHLEPAVDFTCGVRLSTLGLDHVIIQSPESVSIQGIKI